MSRRLAIALLIGLTTVAEGASLRVEDLRCEYLADPLGIDDRAPRLSWRSTAVKADARGLVQTAYQIRVARTEGGLREGEPCLWDTGKTPTDRSLHVPYAGAPLASYDVCCWSVRVWDQDGEVSEWSDPGRWTMGVLDTRDWKGRWIGFDGGDATEGPAAMFGDAAWIWHPGPRPASVGAPIGPRYFRKQFRLPEGRRVRKATLTAAADDSFTAFVNGEPAGRGAGWASIRTVDVTSSLRSGVNAIAVAAVNAESPNVGPERNPAGLIGLLRVEFEEGEPLLTPTDATWRCGESEAEGWRLAAFDDSGWALAVESGKLGASPWGPIAGSEHRRLPARMLRREFDATRDVRRATATVCGLGFFDLEVNGELVGDQLMNPALTGYDRRLCYVTFEVGDRVKKGRNALGVVLANGRFFAPRVNDPVPMHTYGYPKLLLQLRIEYEDGSVEEVVSDDQWRLTTDGPIRASNEFDGEEYDARLEMPGWSSPGFDDSRWRSADLVEAPGGMLEAQMVEPIRVTEVLKPIGLANPKPGVFVVDFGQAYYGTVRLKASGPAGARVTLHTSFNVTPDGLLNAANDRSALNTDVHTLKGRGIETWSPRFKGNATRFVQVEGFPGTPTASNFEGLVTHTDMEPVGEFACSNPLINRIYSNARWGTRMQNRSVPMEPDRDERMPWSGHPAKTSESEAYAFNVARFYDHFLHNYRAHQGEDGSLQEILPPYWTFNTKDIVWPSVVTVIPDWYHDFYGDARPLADNYECMKRWVLFHEKAYLKADGTVDYCNFGDWVDGTWIKDAVDKRVTSRPLISSAYYYNNCRILARAARILEKPEDAERFEVMAQRAKSGFNARFFDSETNTYESRTQASYTFPLAFGLVPEEHRRAVVANFVDEIMVAKGGHTSVGLVGMQWFMQVLTNEGRADVAYHVATRTTRPSWGYMVSKGATTSWERWDTDTQDGGMNGESQKILSGNLEAWLYQTLGGINFDPSRPGFKHVVLRAWPVGDLTSVHARHKSLYGPIESDWKVDRGVFDWTVVVPPNTTATVHVASSDAAAVTEGGKPAGQSPGVRFERFESGFAIYSVGSGRYSFRSPAWKAEAAR